MRRCHVGLPVLVLGLAAMAGANAVAADLSSESLDLALADPQDRFDAPDIPPAFTADNILGANEDPLRTAEPGFRFTLKPDAPDLFMGWQFEF